MKMSLNERLQEELEALEAILMDDISITHNDTYIKMIETIKEISLILNFRGYPELVKTTIFPSIMKWRTICLQPDLSNLLAVMSITENGSSPKELGSAQTFEASYIRPLAREKKEKNLT
ncbi:hypothetical protein NQ317_010506 [Molorchus minor]|uniref:Uncharacterized protein n=1 Tax=Molorchus minor TaxID=1323400 RepID=A0ABQ9JNH5_9CUCU|nr:hypothetical protein NQ317_010506 [Molorchus minor]